MFGLAGMLASGCDTTFWMVAFVYGWKIADYFDYLFFSVAINWVVQLGTCSCFCILSLPGRLKLELCFGAVCWGEDFWGGPVQGL